MGQKGTVPFWPKREVGETMVTYRMDLNDEKKRAAVDIALESPGNVRRRRIVVPLLVAAGALLLVCAAALLLLEDSLDLTFVIVGVAALALGLRAKAFQRWVLGRSEKLLDQAFRSGVVEYRFDDDGVGITSQVGTSLCYWPSFKESGTMGQYLYLRRGDNKLVLVDKNDLTASELAELERLFATHLK